MNGSPFKWLVPALLAASIVTNVVLWNQLKSLRKDRAQLMSVKQDILLLQDQVAEVDKLRLANQEVEKLRRDNTELSRLRNEVRQFREQAPELENLKGQVAQMSQQLAQARQTLSTEKQNTQTQIAAAVQGQVEAQVEEARSIACVSQLKQIGLAARIWSNDHNEVFPPDFVSMHNEMPSPKILVCPSDPARLPPPDWQQFNPAQVSYQYLLPNAPEVSGDPNRILTRCLIHGHIGLSDGSVQRAPKQP